MALNCSSFNSTMEGTDENCETVHMGRLGGSCGTLTPPCLSGSPAEPEQSIDLKAYHTQHGRGQKLMPLEDIERMCLDIIEVLEAGDGRLTGFEMDVSRRNIENTAMEFSSIGTPSNTDRKREKFVPSGDIIDLTSRFESDISRRSTNSTTVMIDLTGEAVKNPSTATPRRMKKEGQKFVPPENVIDLTGEAVKNPSTATPRRMKKEGRKFVPPENVIDLTGEESRVLDTSVRLRPDQESPEEAGQEQSVGNKLTDIKGDDNEDTSGTSMRLEQQPPEEAGQLLQSQEIDVLAEVWNKLDDEFTRANHPRGLGEEDTVYRTGKQRKVNLQSSLTPFVENAIPPATAKRRKGNHGDDLLHDASYEQLLIQCRPQGGSFTPVVDNVRVKQQNENHGVDGHPPMEAVQHVNESMHVESDGHKTGQLERKSGKRDGSGKVERDKNGKGKAIAEEDLEEEEVDEEEEEECGKVGRPQGGSFTPVVDNVRVKQQNGNHGVDGHPPMEAVQHVNESMHVESDGHKTGQLERKSGKRDGSGKVERDKNGKGKAIAEEDLEEEEVDEEEEEECGKVGKVEDPNATETISKIVAVEVDYEPYVREISPAEEDPLDDDFTALRMRFMTGSSGQSPHTKSSPEGTGACRHRNFDFDEVVGYYCGDCGTVGIEMPTSESDPQNKGCIHKNFEFSDETGVYCPDCGRVWQDIQNCYTQIWKGSSKHAQKVQDKHIHELPQVQVTLQGCRGNHDLQGGDLELHPYFENILLSHQKKGFEFLTKNLLGAQQGGHESIGCALAHAPGTGKTCLVISFIQSFLARFPEGKPLILAPAIMLQSWKDQFVHFRVNEVPIYTLGGFRDQDEEDANMAPQVKISLKEARALELREWQKGRSILLLSYNLFQRLVSTGLGDHVLPNSLDDQIVKALQESANLVILDEGHIARNDSSITRAVLALETNRRVLLSGTLFQNNFDELFTLLKICRDDFVRNDPECAKKILEDGGGISSLQRKTNKEIMQIEKKIFMEEIGNRLEIWVKSGETSTDDIKSVVRKFQSLTSPFVDRYPGGILKSLPGLIEHSVHLNLTAFQSEEIINGLVNSEQVKNHMIRHHKITAACIHPSLVREEACLPVSTSNSSPLLDEARKGVKISFIFQLMESANIAKEKLLIFCSTLRPLTYIEDLCCKVWGWRKGQQILRLDGDMSDIDRQKTIQVFNDTGSQSKVLLASTFACSEGISLVGASRVVVLDCLDNPSVIRQAVSRAFRMGQKKKVYVYRLVTTHTHEVKVFRRSVNKEKLSLMLLDEVSTISNLGKFLQEQTVSDIEDELLRDLMLDDRANGSLINLVQRYNAGGQVIS